MPLRIMLVIGTRPEFIKLAPLYLALRQSNEFEVKMVTTGQHTDLLQGLDKFFNVPTDIHLNCSLKGGSLNALAATILLKVDEAIASLLPDVIVVQGDTQTALFAAMAGFFRRLKVVHVEAGLRTGDRLAPFPEEINRIMISNVADLHCAPTLDACRSLKREGIKSDAIFVTGNTSVDALKFAIAKNTSDAETKNKMSNLLPGHLSWSKVAIFTAHRRENFGPPYEEICSGVLQALHDLTDLNVIAIKHPNPNAGQVMERYFNKAPAPVRARLHLIGPQAYQSMAYLLMHCDFLISDSGGLQEESTVVGKPIIVLRKTTERQEAVAAGNAILVGSDAKHIAGWSKRLVEDPVTYAQHSRVSAVYGDGTAAVKICQALRAKYLVDHQQAS